MYIYSPKNESNNLLYRSPLQNTMKLKGLVQHLRVAKG